MENSKKKFFFGWNFSKCFCVVNSRDFLVKKRALNNPHFQSDLTIAFYMPSAFRKCISYGLWNSVPKNRLPRNCVNMPTFFPSESWHGDIFVGQNYHLEPNLGPINFWIRFLIIYPTKMFPCWSSNRQKKKCKFRFDTLYMCYFQNFL